VFDFFGLDYIWGYLLGGSAALALVVFCIVAY
jgi:hypothetical protein